MPTHHDVVILGAGPAGALAAVALARAGIDVALLDKSEFPRPKVCGDCLHPRTWEIWERQGLSDSFAELDHHPIRSLQLSADFHHPLTMDLPHRHGGERAVHREILDAWLLARARGLGVHIQTRCVPYELKPNNILITNQGIIQAKVILGADGRNSWLAHNAGLSRRRRRCPRVAWQTALPASWTSESVHMTFFQEGYFGIARTNALQANLCMVLKSDSAVTPQEIAERYFPGCGPLSWRSTSPITRNAYIPARGSVLLAGDAARVVEPFTGEGIALALASGELAAAHIARAFHHRKLDGLAAAYRTDHRRLYHSLSWQNRLTRWLGEHPGWGRAATRALSHSPSFTRLAASSVFTR
jgi:flavin-dependent dehydrogenase